MENLGELSHEAKIVVTYMVMELSSTTHAYHQTLQAAYTSAITSYNYPEPAEGMEVCVEAASSLLDSALDYYPRMG